MGPTSVHISLMYWLTPLAAEPAPDPNHSQTMIDRLLGDLAFTELPGSVSLCPQRKLSGLCPSSLPFG